MKAATTNLKNFLLNNNECFRADLFTITLLNGTILRATSGQQDIVFGGNTYLSGFPRFSRGPIKIYLGLEVDTMELTMLSDGTVTAGGMPIIQYAHVGGFDGSTVRVETLYMATYGDVSNGSAIKFVGRIAGATQISRTTAIFTVNSLLELLDIQIPRQVIAAGCTWTLFDAGCALSKASFKTSKIAAAGTTKTLLIPSVAFSQADGYFDLGTVTFTSGLNTGVTATVKKHLSGQLQLNVPLPFTPAIADTFDCYPGCDKLQATCSSSKFNNLANFRAEPYVPVPESVL